MLQVAQLLLELTDLIDLPTGCSALGMCGGTVQDEGSQDEDCKLRNAECGFQLSKPSGGAIRARLSE